MQQMKLKERKINISRAMDAEERFHHKRMGFIKLHLHTKQQILFKRIALNYKKRNVIVDGQIVVKTCEDGTLKYNHHHNIEKRRRTTHGRMADKKLVASIVSSREKGIERRKGGATTSSHKENGEESKQQQMMHSSSKGGGRQMLRHIDGDVPMCLGKKERMTKEKQEEVSSSEVSKHTSNHDEGTVKEKKGEKSSSSSKCRNPTSTNEDSKDVTFIVFQKDTRSMSSSVRIDEMFSELQGCRWGAILVSETWRPAKEEFWETKRGHIIMCAGKIENKHGVAIVNKKWKHKINWTDYISERAIATSITVNTQRITLMSVYMPRSGYADHHVEKAYNMIEKVIKSMKSKCRSSVATSTLNLAQALELSEQV